MTWNLQEGLENMTNNCKRQTTTAKQFLMANNSFHLCIIPYITNYWFPEAIKSRSSSQHMTCLYSYYMLIIVLFF